VTEGDDEGGGVFGSGRTTLSPAWRAETGCRFIRGSMIMRVILCEPPPDIPTNA
jgi:hypothetical protein